MYLTCLTLKLPLLPSINICSSAFSWCIWWDLLGFDFHWMFWIDWNIDQWAGYKLTQTEYEWSKFGYESTEYETSLETKWLDTLCKWSRYMCLSLNHADAKLTISYNFFLNLPMLHCIEMCILEINLAHCSVFNLYFGFFNTQ